MKRLFLILAILVLVGCSNNNTDKKTSESIPKSSKEKTLSLNKEFRYLNEDIKNKEIYKKHILSPEYSISDDMDSLVQNSDSIIIGRVIGKEDSFIECKGCFIETPIKFEVLHSLKGNIGKTVDINQPGGVVSLRTYRDNNFESSNEKAGLYKLSDYDLDNKYIESYPSAYKELKYDGIYIIFFFNVDGVNYNTLDAYSILEYKGDYADTMALSQNTSFRRDPLNFGKLEFEQEINNKTYTLNDIVNVIDNNK